MLLACEFRVLLLREDAVETSLLAGAGLFARQGLFLLLRFVARLLLLVVRGGRLLLERFDVRFETTGTLKFLRLLLLLLTSFVLFLLAHPGKSRPFAFGVGGGHTSGSASCSLA